jgi:integrase
MKPEKLNSVPGASTITAAKAHVKKLKEKGLLLPPKESQAPLTFSKFAENFWGTEGIYANARTKAGHVLSPRYLQNMQEQVTCRLNPVFGTKVLAELNTRQIETWLHDLRDNGVRISKANQGSTKGRSIKLKVSTNVADKAFDCLKRMLNEAVRLGILATNPAEKVLNIKVESLKKEAFSREQRDLIFNRSCDDHIWLGNKIAYYGSKVSLATGLRLSEVIALQFGYVREDGWFFLNYSVKQEGKLGTTKSGKGRWARIRPNLLLELKREFPHQGFIFSTDGKIPVGKEQVNRPFTRVLKALDLKTPGLTFHSLRHTFNTFLHGQAVSQNQKQIMAMVGHNSERVNEIYTHFDPGMMADAVLAQDLLVDEFYQGDLEGQT